MECNFFLLTNTSSSIDARNYFYVRPVNSTDHTGHTCNCHEVGFDPVKFLIVQRKPG